MTKNNIIEVQNIKVNITKIEESDYICISDFRIYSFVNSLNK